VRDNANVNVVVAGVLDQIALVVRSASGPVATVVADLLASCWVAISVKRQRLVGAHACTGQRHVNGGRVCLRRLQCAGQTLGILLGEDGLLIHLIVDRVGEKVAASHEVSGALNCAVADDGDLCRASWRCHQRD
jgi:hypothetical protein